MTEFIKVTQVFTLPKDWRPIPTDAFDVKIQGQHVGLKRMLWWGLKKLGCVSAHWDREMMVTSMILDPERITVAVIAKAQRQFNAMYPGKNAAVVYMGNQDLADLLSDPVIASMGAFSFPGKAHRSNGRGGYTILNLEIQVVPHMRGILVV